ncbi:MULTISPECIES: CDGSH iron-sulfur domain-containing protein [Thermus]|jgi:CDGSH-type Zn-finger protein|uniref:Iron-binding zinc finger CDGSH type n=1 Tax=Thermus brockianus TaxID=56956 RepID=A0A1J0LS17_THEBO|nr:CDGSH iron-sulfur domain-containing protein [Thermus brockianus]APD08866.1 Iron-binding zinc finger CDGSH type [Thermus brockianus]
MRLRFRENGPLVLDLPEGTPFRFNGEERRLERAKLALCRCGHSANKPFCDGTHKAVGFQAEAGELEVQEVQ